jgi:hypothetical protein
VQRLLLRLLPLRGAAAAPDAAQLAECQAAAAVLQQLFMQSDQLTLLSWLRGWLPQQLLQDALPSAAMPPFDFSRAAMHRSSSSSRVLWQQVNDLVHSVPTALSAANPYQLEVIVGPAGKRWPCMHNSVLDNC